LNIFRFIDGFPIVLKFRIAHFIIGFPFSF
jgi:hypothetical protein